MAKPAPLPWLVRLSIALHATCLALLLLHPAWCLGLLALVAGNHVILGAAGLWPRSQLLGRTVYRLPAAGRVVCLTFDDGPDPAVTPAVLDCLAAWGATASFFCIGARAQAHPTLVRRIAAAGHGVENHTLSHKTYFACLGLRSLHAEVAPVQSILAGHHRASATLVPRAHGASHPTALSRTDPCRPGAGHLAPPRLRHALS